MKTSTLWTQTNKLLTSNSEIIVFDVETTGLKRTEDRIIEFAAVKYYIQGDALLEGESLHLYINPGFPLIEKITEITGLTDEFLADKPSESEVFQQIYDFMGISLVAGYNIDTFDMMFMEALYLRHGTDFITAGTVDVLKLARDRISKMELKSHKLASVAEYFHITFTAHAALEDVRTTSKILQIIITEYRAEDISGGFMSGSMRPYIKRISYWKNPHRWDRNRIYVSTSAGEIYFCHYKREWLPNEIVEMLDIDWIEKEAWRLTKTSDTEEFLKFKGKIVA